MPGHCTANVIFKQPEVLSVYTCPKCSHLLRDAVQTCCGHWLCMSCAENIAKEKNSCCPKEGCGEPFSLNDIIPDPHIRKVILSLEVRCSRSHKGCDWEGRFSELQMHLTTCAFMECEFCLEAFCRSELESHKTRCPKVQKESPLALGCGAMTPQDELSEHLEYHMSMLKKLLERSKAPVITTQAVEATDHVLVGVGGILIGGGVLMTDGHQGAVQDEAATELKHDLMALQHDLRELREMVYKLEKVQRSKTADFEDRDFRLSLIENSNHDGTMVWKIPQFTQRMDDAKSGKRTSIFSQPFYTGRYGYKICLQLYILGDGIGKGSYMSLFFVLMKGEFDNILQWPFTHKVTFKLINQSKGRDVVDTFQPDPVSSSFHRPKFDMNVASGCPKFVPHVTLNNFGFIVNDTIFIECVVDAYSSLPIPATV